MKKAENRNRKERKKTLVMIVYVVLFTISTKRRLGCIQDYGLNVPTVVTDGVFQS